MQAAEMSLTQAKKWNKIAWIVIAVCMVFVVLYFIFVLGLSFFGTIMDSL